MLTFLIGCLLWMCTLWAGEWLFAHGVPLIWVMTFGGVCLQLNLPLALSVARLAKRWGLS